MATNKLRVVISESDGNPAIRTRVVVEPYKNVHVSETGFVRLKTLTVFTDSEGIAVFDLIPSDELDNMRYAISIDGIGDYSFMMPGRDVYLHDLDLTSILDNEPY